MLLQPLVLLSMVLLLMPKRVFLVRKSNLDHATGHSRHWRRMARTREKQLQRKLNAFFERLEESEKHLLATCEHTDGAPTVLDTLIAAANDPRRGFGRRGVYGALPPPNVALGEEDWTRPSLARRRELWY